MKKFSISKSLLLLVLFTIFTNKNVYADQYKYTPAVENGYTLVVMPDTQTVVENYPDIMTTTIDALINQKDQINIKGVLHVGDIVNRHSAEDQFIFASNELNKIPKAKVKTILTPGNHDYTWLWDENNEIVGVNDLYYNKYFGPGSEFNELSPYYITNSPSTRSGYAYIESGQEYDYLVLSLSWYDIATNPEELKWAENVLMNNVNKPTIVLTHNFLRPSLTNPGELEFSWESSSISNEVWDVLRKYDQVFMVISGHHQGNGSKTLLNNHGNEVHFILTDYQFSYKGGNGHMEYIEFDEIYNKLHVNTYSPYVGSMDPEEVRDIDKIYGSHLMFDLDFDQRFGNLPEQSDFNFHWAIDSIKYVTDMEIMEIDGKNNLFRPDEKATRYEVVDALARLEKIEEKDLDDKEEIFEDVDEKYLTAVNWAIENEIVKGYEDNSFQGENPITREEMAAILNRYIINLEKDIPQRREVLYEDIDLVSDWALDDVISISNRGLLSGKGQGLFDPQANITRAEVAQIVVNIVEESK